MKPVIGISANISNNAKGGDQASLEFEYLCCVHSAGGEPFIISPFSSAERAANLIDGWLITGGADLPPCLYGQPLHEQTKLMDERRTTMEQRMFEQFKNTGKPILGICFGMQFLNVMHGGTLQQHLPDQVKHERHTQGESLIRIEPGSRLDAIGLPREFKARCFHHQAVDQAAEGWNVVAHDSDDGCIEAIEQSGSSWRIGVQWHPERTAESEASKKLFRAFVEACSG